MEIYCTRPGCPRPLNQFADLDDRTTLKTVQQKYCTACGMPLILDGRYLTERLLGQGGFGTAFLARDRRTPAMRLCAVKQFQPSGDLSPEQLAIAHTLFEREAIVLEQLGNQHPQIPDLFAFFPLEIPGKTAGTSEQFFYLVQEYIDGSTLEGELETKGPFSLADTIAVFEEILSILDFIHTRQVIHRDIKPSNIIRSNAGPLYLLDFGAVKQVAQTATLSAGGQSTGIYSMGFAPPEQMAGRTVFPATDLYALAVTCIVLLTGKDPQELFDAYSNQWNWRSHVPLPQSGSDAKEARFADLLDRLLLATPSERYQSVREVCEALNPPGSPVSAPPTPAPTPMGGASGSPVSRRRFSDREIQIAALFTGYEAGLGWIVLASLDLPPSVKTIAWLLFLSALYFAQATRAIQKYDLAILAGVSLAIVLIVEPLRIAFSWIAAIGLPISIALLAFVLTWVWLWLYRRFF
jgi:serine/threonine protein kinase